MSQRPARVQRFDTQHLPADERFAHWARACGRSFGYAGLDSPAKQDFVQSLTRADLGSALFLRMRGSATSSHADAGQLADVDARPFHLVIRIGSGVTTIEQQHETSLAPGDMVLVDARRAYRMCSEPSTDLLLVGFSAPAAARWLPGVDDAVGLKVGADSGWGATLSAYLRALDPSLADHIQTAREEELVAEHILSMLSFALTQRVFKVGEGDAASVRDRALHVQMHDWIRDNHADPAADVTALAMHFGVSVRYVHKVFAGAGGGLSFGEALKRERLDAAVRLLRTAVDSHTFISQIAGRCGFTNAAYFGMVFRKTFGCSPGTFARSRGRIAAPIAHEGGS